MTGDAHRAGMVALVGRPSAGKSTLLNRLIGQKIAIVSAKPQTTRARILAVLTAADYQIGLIDTPGLHAKARGLAAALNQAAEQAARDVDLVALVVDATDAPEREGAALLERLAPALDGRRRSMLLLNKVDKFERARLLPLIARWAELHPFDDIYPLSALSGDNVEGLGPALAKLLPEGPPLYPESAAPGGAFAGGGEGGGREAAGGELITDQNERTLCAELIREQVYRLTQAEVPYSVAVEVENFDESRRGPPKPVVHIDAVIFVERESQKGILIGKGAGKLKAIGSGARREIEAMLDCRVFLGLTVRVEPDWTLSPAALRRFGYGAA